MKISLSTPITDLRGTPIRNGEIDLVLSEVCITALLAPDQAEEPAEDKVKRYKLAVKCSNGKDPDFSAEDIVLLKKLVGKIYAPLVVGKAFEILDPEH
jgi:hypothetical protein